MSPQGFRIIISYCQEDNCRPQIKNKTRTKKYSTIVLRCLLAHEFVCVWGGSSRHRNLPEQFLL